ncbi:MAG: Cupin 2 protein [Patescibacteria group bacterium]|nr:Cupin 2 protein [Patescibacteria group bacterium]
MARINEVVTVWQEYLAGAPNWEKLVAGVEPKAGGCGLVYELSNPIDRPNESLAIADMRNLELSDPHKHINGETEVYFVLQGKGKIVVGHEVSQLAPGVIIVTPPDTLHITLPGKDLVLAVVNMPPFELNNYVAVPRSDPTVARALDLLRAH